VETLYRPPKPLGDFVDCLWHWDGEPAPAPRERALPSGTLDLVINLGRDELCFFDETEQHRLAYSGAVMCGVHARYLVIEPPQRCAVMGAHFKPGGAFPFIADALHALEGRQVDLDTLFGPSARELRERLLEASTIATRLRLLEAWLLARAHKPLEYHPAVAAALQAFEEPTLNSVAAVCSRTGYSAKRLIALVREQIGLTPKAYWRVRRFQAALRRLGEGQPLRGAELSPSRYLSHEIVRANHVPLRG
jgi:hypothetical protein